MSQRREVATGGEIAARNEITITAHLDEGPLSATFTLLGPGEAVGYPCNVPRCPICGARADACVCRAR